MYSDTQTNVHINIIRAVFKRLTELKQTVLSQTSFNFRFGIWTTILVHTEAKTWLY